MKSISKTSALVKNRYAAKHYKSINIDLKIELVEAFNQKLKERGETKTEIIRRAILKYLEDTTDTEAK